MILEIEKIKQPLTSINDEKLIQIYKKVKHLIK